MPITSTSTDARIAADRDPGAGRDLEHREHGGPRPALDVPRWRSVRPETSSSALRDAHDPQRDDRHDRHWDEADHGDRRAPGDQRDGEHAGEPALGADRRAPTNAPTIPPRPIAAPSTPTPASPMPRTSIARIGEEGGQRAADDGLDDERRAITMPAGGRPTSSRMPADERDRAASAPRARRGGRDASGTRIAIAAATSTAQPRRTRGGRRGAEPCDHEAGDQRPGERARGSHRARPRCWR